MMDKVDDERLASATVGLIMITEDGRTLTTVLYLDMDYSLNLPSLFLCAASGRD